MKKFLLFLLVPVLFSCSEDEEPIICCTVYDVGLDIKYVDEAGMNLLETEDPVALHDIDVYHKIDGEWKGYFEGHHDISNSVRIIDRDEEKYLRIFLSQEIDEASISETRLVIRDASEIIIKAEVSINGGNTIVTKVWHDGELKWEARDSAERLLTVVE